MKVRRHPFYSVFIFVRVCGHLFYSVFICVGMRYHGLYFYMSYCALTGPGEIILHRGPKLTSYATDLTHRIF